MASRWHWRDTRKVLRSLKVLHDTGKRHSDWIREQEEAEQESEVEVEEGASSMSGAPSGAPRSKPRVRRLLFWVWCEPEVLKARLDGRVEKMIDVSAPSLLE